MLTKFVDCFFACQLMLLFGEVALEGRQTFTLNAQK